MLKVVSAAAAAFVTLRSFLHPTVIIVERPVMIRIHLHKSFCI